MVSEAAANGMDGIADTLAAFARSEGTAAHPYARSADLFAGREAARNLADAVHYLCMLHGRHPGVIDMAAARADHDAALSWLGQAVPAFAEERAYLTKLVVAVGPLPSTPGQSACEATIVGQRHALEMIARSDRSGCAIGAAFGVALDWPAIRRVLDAAADRFGLPPSPCVLPDEGAVRAACADITTAVGIGRAIGFGARQVLVQHHGLWDLLETRAHARSAGS